MAAGMMGSRQQAMGRLARKQTNRRLRGTRPRPAPNLGGSTTAISARTASAGPYSGASPGIGSGNPTYQMQSFMKPRKGRKFTATNKTTPRGY